MSGLISVTGTEMVTHTHTHTDPCVIISTDDRKAGHKLSPRSHSRNGFAESEKWTGSGVKRRPNGTGQGRVISGRVQSDGY